MTLAQNAYPQEPDPSSPATEQPEEVEQAFPPPAATPAHYDVPEYYMGLPVMRAAHDLPELRPEPQSEQAPEPNAESDDDLIPAVAPLYDESPVPAPEVDSVQAEEPAAAVPNEQPLSPPSTPWSTRYQAALAAEPVPAGPSSASPPTPWAATPVQPAPEPVITEPTPQPEVFSPALVELCQKTGLGLVRVDSESRCWPLNPAAESLLKALGGATGEPAPPAVRQAIATGSSAAEAAEAAVSEARHISASAVRLEQGSIVALRDHTDERLLQERLLQSEKMASVGQLVSGVAHELNNPLTGVMGFAQLLLARELDETVRSQIQTIYGEAERAAKIVQNLLSFARRRKPTKEMADVNALLQRVLELRSYDFAIRNISLDMTMDARMDRVWVDPDQVQQVFFNLIKNAEQAMIDSHGGGRLTVVTRGLPAGVRISIADDGPGIPLDVQRRIFDPFFTTKEAGQGTGLGLTICYGIIDEHGGRIWTENLPAGGAVFHIDLPHGVAEEREPEGSRGGAAAEVGLPPAISGRRILVVDDEESIRLLLHDILRLDRHEVRIARSGLEAAALTRNEQFDVVITDMKMPGMDGASFYRQVRDRDPEQARRIIFITGDTVSPDTRAFLQQVSNPVLSKPFKIGPLRDAIERVLAGG